jgi:hypothetical protein
MRIIIVALLLVLSVGANAQRIVPIGNGRTTDTGLIVGSLKVDSVLVFPAYRTTNTNMVLGFDSRGKAVLRINNDSLIWATNAYVDSGLASISAGAVDTNNYISSITRLNREIDSVSNIIDSNNTIIYGRLDTAEFNISEAFIEIGNLQNEFTNVYDSILVLDSAIGVAFGAISTLYDTLPNYVDTAQLNDSLQAIKSAYVPYTGATTDVNLGTHNILPNSVRLSTTPTGTLTNVGQLYWDATNVTASIPLNANVSMQIGQEEHVRARNNTGVQINDGQVVYINGAQGNNPTIALANSDSVNTSDVIGVATENIADNGTGFVTTYGVVNGVNTASFTSGDALYLSATNGTITNVIPTPPHNVVRIGVALNSTNNGKIFVKPSQAIGQDTTFAAPYNSNKVAPTQRAIGTYVRKIVKDTASALRTAINSKGTVTSIQLVGGTNVTITPTTAITTSGTYTISATGGSSTIVKANEFNMLYKANGDTTIRGTTKVRVDTTDSRMEFAFDTTTSTVTTDPHGGVKIWGSNRMGMGAVRINDTVSIPAALQRAINTQITSTLMPNTTLITGAAATGNYSIGGPVSIMPTSSPLLTNVVSAYNSTIQHLNYTKLVITTQTGANIAAGIRCNSNLQPLGIITGNTKFSGGGGRGTFTFSFPTYNAGQRIFVGYSSVISQPLVDPTTFLGANNGLGVGKDAADTTLQFFNSNSVTVPTKVNTGVTPNAEDVYRVTVYVAPNSTYYIQLEVISKSAPIRVITYNPTTFVPPVGIKIYPMQWINNAATAAAIQYGFIYAMEEIY